MPRKNRTHIDGDNASTTEVSLAPKHLVKEEFGSRLYRLMLAKGWNQAELSRRSYLPRDSISMYIRGRTLPTPQSLQKLSKALGVEPTEILPNHAESAMDEGLPSMEFKVSQNSPDVSWLRVNRLVSTKTALKIMEMLEADDAIDRARSSGAA